MTQFMSNKPKNLYVIYIWMTNSEIFSLIWSCVGIVPKVKAVTQFTSTNYLLETIPMICSREQRVRANDSFLYDQLLILPSTTNFQFKDCAIRIQVWPGSFPCHLQETKDKTLEFCGLRKIFYHLNYCGCQNKIF